MPFQQRTNTSCYLAIPTHGFTVVLSVFRGTPPPKPLDCKIRDNSTGALLCDRWAHPTGGEPRLSRAFLIFRSADIFKTSFRYLSQFFYRVASAFGGTQSCSVPNSLFVSRPSGFFKPIKNPAYIAVSRVGNSLSSMSPAYLVSIRIITRLVRHYRG